MKTSQNMLHQWIVKQILSKGEEGDIAGIILKRTSKRLKETSCQNILFFSDGALELQT